MRSSLTQEHRKASTFRCMCHPARSTMYTHRAPHSARLYYSIRRDMERLEQTIVKSMRIEGATASVTAVDAVVCVRVPHLQCGGAEVQWCGGAVVQWCGGAVVQWCSDVEVRTCSGVVVRCCTRSSPSRASPTRSHTALRTSGVRRRVHLHSAPAPWRR